MKLSLVYYAPNISSRTNLLCHAAILKRSAISQFRFQTIKENEFLYIVYNFGDIRSRNPRVYAVNNSTFCGDIYVIGATAFTWPVRIR